MLIKQISVFLENKTGRLSDVIAALGGAGIDITALSMADTTDFGVLRMIVDNPDQAALTLRDEGVIVKISEVLALEMDDKPGAFAAQLKKLSDNGVSVEYMYAFTARNQNRAMMVLRTDDAQRAQKILE